MRQQRQKQEQRKQKRQRSSRRLLVFGLVAALPSLGVSSCAGTPPAIDAQQWLGSSELKGVVSSSDELVKCESPAFDKYGCYTLEDLERIWTTVYGCCERWNRACAAKALGASP